MGHPAQLAQARLGSVLNGKWRLERVLGVGGVAAVYLATHRNRSRAALKLLHAEQAQNPIVCERFVHEGYAANSIDHPGVVKVLDDAISDDGLPYLVMELLEGETLEHRAHRFGERLPPSEVLAITDQLLDVLAVAHDKSIVHRDLKPDNLFLTVSGRLKVLDFGIARLLQGATSRDVTAVGTLLGTPAFMPPEQARSRWDEVDATSDLYSVGATMFNLLTGRMLRDAETLTEQLALAIHEPAPTLASVDTEQHPGVCQLVDRALSYERRDRYQDARAMQVELRRVRELLPPPATSSVTPRSADAERAGSIENVPTLLESGRHRDTVEPILRSKPTTIAIERRIAALLLLGLLAGLALATWFVLRQPTREVAEANEAERALPRGAAGATSAPALTPSPTTVAEPIGPSSPAVQAPAASSPRSRSVSGASGRKPESGRAAIHSEAPPVSHSAGAARPSAEPVAAPDDPFSKRY